MKAAARLNDSCSCPKNTPAPHIASTIIESSSNVFFAGQPAARTGDGIKCNDNSYGKLTQSNACVLINGKLAMRVGDKTNHDGEIKTGAPGIYISDGEPFIEIGNIGVIEMYGEIYLGC